MTKNVKSGRTVSSRLLRPTPHPTSHPIFSDEQKGYKLQRMLVLERKNYVGATCPVCMEFPHNAILLLCSSHDKGCRPYLCGTNYLHSNCFDQFNMTCSKVRYKADMSTIANTICPLRDIPQISELACPLCRGLVKGWTVVEPARKYLNNKKRNCMQDSCSFIGTYEELEKHVKSEQLHAKLKEASEQHDLINGTTLPFPRSIGIRNCILWVPPSGEWQFEEFRGMFGIGRKRIYVLRHDDTFVIPYQGNSNIALIIWRRLMDCYARGVQPDIGCFAHPQSNRIRRRSRRRHCSVQN